MRAYIQRGQSKSEYDKQTFIEVIDAIKIATRDIFNKCKQWFIGYSRVYCFMGSKLCNCWSN